MDHTRQSVVACRRDVGAPRQRWGTSNGSYSAASCRPRDVLRDARPRGHARAAVRRPPDRSCADDGTDRMRALLADIAQRSAERTRATGDAQIGAARAGRRSAQRRRARAALAPPARSRSRSCASARPRRRCATSTRASALVPKPRSRGAGAGRRRGTARDWWSRTCAGARTELRRTPHQRQLHRPDPCVRRTRTREGSRRGIAVFRADPRAPADHLVARWLPNIAHT